MPIERVSADLDRLLSVDQDIQELGDGFGGDGGPAEGPLWWSDGGYLLFSDIHNNRRMKWSPGRGHYSLSAAHQSRQRTHPRSEGKTAGLRAQLEARDAPGLRWRDNGHS